MFTVDVVTAVDAESGPEAGDDASLFEDMRGEGCCCGKGYLDSHECDQEYTGEDEQGYNPCIVPLGRR